MLEESVVDHSVSTPGPKRLGNMAFSDLVPKLRATPPKALLYPTLASQQTTIISGSSLFLYTLAGLTSPLLLLQDTPFHISLALVAPHIPYPLPLSESTMAANANSSYVALSNRVAHH